MNKDDKNFTHIMGLDLGVMSDYTALSIVKKWYEWYTNLDYSFFYFINNSIWCFLFSI